MRVLSDWKTLITWSTTSIQDDWNTWEEWQRSQPPIHYEKSDIFQYYLSCRPSFQPPYQSVSLGQNSKYYIYCFGDFATVMVNPDTRNVFEYFKLLLDIYDVCKGYSRRITGDPTGIAILRDTIKRRKLDGLESHDFKQYEYSYTSIHAHTVAQYSLSTLIMRLIENYMSYLNFCRHYIAISTPLCKKSYEGCVFGAPFVQPTMRSISEGILGLNMTSDKIPIERKRSKSNEFKGLSLPRDSAMCVRCQTCSRITERPWGVHKVCLDCHIKRICSKCGKPAAVIGVDNFPKCQKHQDHQINDDNIMLSDDSSTTDRKDIIDEYRQDNLSNNNREGIINEYQP